MTLAERFRLDVGLRYPAVEGRHAAVPTKLRTKELGRAPIGDPADIGSFRWFALVAGSVYVLLRFMVLQSYLDCFATS